jgi:Tfp pilus assembly protein PilV
MRILRNTKGISIVELLVSSTLIGIAVLGVAGFLQSASFKNNTSKVDTVGATLAERTLEEQKALGYFGLTTSASAPVTVENKTYARAWNWTQVNSRLRKIHVTISWANGQVQTAAYLARPK